MPSWNHTLDVSAAWKASNDGTGTIKSVVQAVNTQVGTLPDALQDEYSTLFADDLNGLVEDAGDGDIDGDDFDEVWSAVYDWADSRRIWIKTAF